MEYLMEEMEVNKDAVEIANKDKTVTEFTSSQKNQKFWVKIFYIMSINF